jgi:ribonucleoside-triphosphate reductase
MLQNKIAKVKKRDGTIADFDQSKITNAIFKAITATGQGDGNRSRKLSDKVVQILSRRFKKNEIPNVEQIQDIIEEVLVLEGFVETAKAYIIYREQRRRIREAITISEEAVERMDQYLEKLDWEVQENANMSFSLQGLNHYSVSYIVKKYWLNKIYPKEIREANESGDFHLHNLDTLGPYCAGWDLYDLLLKGFGGVSGKVETKPAKHFCSALGQVVNFIFTIQGEVAGAVAFSNFDTLLAPFIRYDNLNYQQVKQALQEFMFNMSVPTRVGFQNPFSNITLDLKPSPTFAKQPVIIGGKLQKETYGEFEEEMKIFNKALYEVMLEGDKNQRVFSFPIPTINITKDFPWDEPAFDGIFEASAKYGINYFANYINSDMDPSDVRSMCCRLRLQLTELYNRGGGGLFGSGAKTGSIGVVTVNLPRIGYLSKTKKEFFERLGKMMDLAEESLEIKRKTIENFIEKGLYPYSRFYLSDIKKARGGYYANHFATIGLIGMNESLLNFIGENIASRRGRNFTLEVLDFMRKKLVKYQEETGNIYNLEQTPAESTSYRLALKDKEKYPNIITAGTKKVPYYTNSSQLPVNYTDDILEALKLQDELTCKYNGGSVLHLFLGERVSDIQTVKNLVKKIFENFELPYITLTPTFSICPSHGYLEGEHFECPKCTIKQPCEVYSRVVGYIRPVNQYNIGKQQEFKERKTFKIRKLELVKT